MYTLVTGASSGIGLSLAKHFANIGHNLILVARRENLLSKIKDDLKNSNIDIKIFSYDLSNIDQIGEFYERVKNEGLKVNVLVNNAGFGYGGYFIDANFKTFEDMINLNVMALTKLTHLFLGDMRVYQHEVQCYVLNVGSTASFFSGPLMSIYFATKAYVLNFSRSLNFEMKKQDLKIFVSTLCPGSTKTEFTERAGLGKTYFSSLPDDPDLLAVYAVKKMYDKKEVILFGLKNKLLIFFSKILPTKLLMNKVYKLQQNRINRI